MLRAALIQTTAGDDPQANIARMLPMIAAAAEGGAKFVLTPELSNCLSSSRALLTRELRHEEDDPTLCALGRAAAGHGVWLLAGSVALKAHDDDRFVNRSVLFGPGGGIVTRYDKIHMFDVAVSPAETFRESAGFRPGERAVIAHTPIGSLGLSVCYDLRFPGLYRALARAGAEILTVPAAFNDTTGAAHWEVLLRARAIETGCFVLAPAQTGDHPAREGRGRRSWGHSLAVSPWGEVLADGGTEPGITFVDLDLDQVSRVRRRLPSLTHDRAFAAP